MGADDANDGPGECPSHDWWPTLAGWRLDEHGLLQRTYECPHCGAVTVMGPGEHPTPV